MSRWVNAASAPRAEEAVAGVRPGTSGDDPAARIVKYIPAEVVATFTMVVSAMAAAKIKPPPVSEQQFAAGAIGLFFLGTIIYVWNQTPPGPVRNAHIWLSPLAFLAWSYPIAGTALADWFVPAAAVALQAFVLMMSILIVPKEP